MIIIKLEFKIYLLFLTVIKFNEYKKCFKIKLELYYNISMNTTNYINELIDMFKSENDVEALKLLYALIAE